MKGVYPCVRLTPPDAIETHIPVIGFPLRSSDWTVSLSAVEAEYEAVMVVGLVSVAVLQLLVLPSPQRWKVPPW